MGSTLVERVKQEVGVALWATALLGLVVEKAWLAPGKPFLSLFLHNWVYKICSSHFIGI